MPNRAAVLVLILCTPVVAQGSTTVPIAKKVAGLVAQFSDDKRWHAAAGKLIGLGKPSAIPLAEALEVAIEKDEQKIVMRVKKSG